MTTPTDIANRALQVIGTRLAVSYGGRTVVVRVNDRGPPVSGPHPDPLSYMLSKPHELDGRFEREAKTVTTCISDAALTSIAVSLKRIADAMDGGDASQGIQNSLFFLEQKMHGQ